MNNKPFKIVLWGLFVFSFIFFGGFAGKALAQSETTAETATATVGSSTWITVFAPFTGDDNHNGYTIFRYGTNLAGPFTQVSGFSLPGPSEWRVTTVNDLTAGASYYFEVEHVDPDGVIFDPTGVTAPNNPQVIGPFTTSALPSNPTVVSPASYTVGDAEIFVSVPITGDSDRFSTGTIDISPSEFGPWELKAGYALPFNPKRARIRSLIPGTDYWILVQIFDNNGGTLGDWYQLFGPITYTGAENLALGKTITADPGWATIWNDPAKLVDGRIQYPTGNDGFAWAIGGLPSTWKQATIDFGTPTEFNKVVIWHRFPKGIPSDWKIQVSDDGAVWTDVFVPAILTCRTDTVPLFVSFLNPSCAFEADFDPVTAQYVRYTFDETTTFEGKRGWALEFEVFNVEPEIPDPDIEVEVDIRPGACPNSINLKKKGPAKAAILGAVDFDVSRIDPATVVLTREGYETNVAPESFNYEDVATPFTGAPCDCHDLLEDGFMDLVLKFDTQALIEAFELDTLADGETIPLILTGNLAEAEGGTPISGSDCITIKKKEKEKKNK